MENRKSYIPFKLLLGYFALAALLALVTVLLFSENTAFSETEKQIVDENYKILKINSFLFKVHENESLSRVTILSGSQEDFKQFNVDLVILTSEIDTLKQLVKSEYQTNLLDSVQVLLSMKKSNIEQLLEIKSRIGKEKRVSKAIDDIAQMENTLRKLTLGDFVRNPEKLKNYQHDVLQKYVDYLNQNIPDDETNSLSTKVLDSMLVASRGILNQVRYESLQSNQLVNDEEKKLLDNELLISAQLRKILIEIETKIVQNTTENNAQKTEALNRIIRIVTTFAGIGLALALIFSLLILNDFLKTKQYKEQLEITNNRAKTLLISREQLISTVSHDLKTPLSTIAGYCELLSAADLSPKQQYFNSNIKGAYEYISRLVQDLLDFTQIEAGKISVENIPISLPEIIRDVTTSVQGIYPSKPIKLSISIDPELNARIIGDPFRLRQILTNLVGNAYKFTAEGAIKIRTKANIGNGTFIIEVEDSGIGIASDKLHLIFEEFVQADKTVEKRFGGTGLGLTISKKMTEILGGTLKVTSKEGSGSTFSIELPLVIDKSSQTNIAKHLIIAVIDDDINLLNLTAEALKLKNHIVLPYSSGSEALSDLPNRPFDIVLTDLQMPEMSGMEVLNKLLNAEWFKKLGRPIIAVTGKADANSETYKAAGFTALIRKPYSPQTLNDQIQTIINQQPILENFNAEDINHESAFSRLQAFFPDDSDALNSVLLTFIGSTKANMELLQHVINNNSTQEIQEIAHKMRPMFRQLGADDCASILFKLETDKFPKQELQNLYAKLKPLVTSLITGIEDHINNQDRNSSFYYKGSSS